MPGGEPQGEKIPAHKKADILLISFLFCPSAIQETHRYLCNDEAEVICLHGWREPEDEDLRWLI